MRSVSKVSRPLSDVSDEDKKAFFDALDTDKDGRITLEEFKKFLNKFLQPAEVPSDQLIHEMFRAADKDGSGTITLDGR